MSEDLIERLRGRGENGELHPTPPMCHEAADAIESLSDTIKAYDAQAFVQGMREIESLRARVKYLVATEANEVARLRMQLEGAMKWQPATVNDIDVKAFYMVKDNGGEWRDFDLRILSGWSIAMKLKPDYVRGRPLWIAKINPPSAADLTKTDETSTT